MSLLNGWVLLGLIPLFLLYKRNANNQNKRQTQLLYLSLLFMFVAMARPTYEEGYTDEKFDAHDYIIALDVSYSMQAEDIKPNRYEASKAAIKKLIQEHPKDRFTLFAFTSQTLLLSPPTSDSEISLMALDALNPEYILTKSTNIYNLFATVATLQQRQKNLIIFSDGGDEHNLANLAKLAKKHNIIPFIVATATQKGAALKKDDKYIKDTTDAIVISKINPMLIDLANATNGYYYKITDTSAITQLSNDIAHDKTKKEKIKIKTYTEFFYIPLFLALVLFFISVTKLIQPFLIFIPLLFITPQSVKADLLDFHHLDTAYTLYEQQHYLKAAHTFSRLTPSVQSYYNTGVAFYKAGHYRDAIAYFTQIKTTDRTLKQKILYNLGNCAAKIKKYDEAKEFYLSALALEEDADTLYNLRLLQKMRLKTIHDITDIMPRKQSQKQKKTPLKGEKKKEQQGKNSNAKKGSNQSSNNSSNGSGTGKKKKQQSNSVKKQSTNKSQYKFTYKAYEKINKGYTDEKEPW